MTTAVNVAPGTHYIVVDGSYGDECAFELTVTCDESVPVCCPMPYVCVAYDFNESDHGFSATRCGGLPVEDCTCTELCHTYQCEEAQDGGNVKI